MAPRKKSDIEEEDTEAPQMPPPPSGRMVRITVTKFGEGKISTGVHVAGEGDVLARRGDVLEAPAESAASLEASGLAEIVE